MIPRVHWNCHGKCNLNCRFCYGWFDDKPALDTLHAEQLIDKIAPETDHLVFGGGDPVLRRDIETLARRAHVHGLHVELQTNCVALDFRKLKRLRPYLDRLGVSIEGEDARMHGTMRGDSSNFHHIFRIINYCDYLSLPVVVRTLITRLNLGRICGLAYPLRKYRIIAAWRLREFLPLGKGLENRATFEISPDEFEGEVARIQLVARQIGLEFPVVGKRLTGTAEPSCYFLIAPNGDVYSGDEFDAAGTILHDSVKTLECRLRTRRER